MRSVQKPRHKRTVELETKRLILRRFKRGDAAAAYRNWTSDPIVTKYLSWKPHRTLKDTKIVMELWVEQYGKRDFYQWAICEKEHDEPIGSIGVVSKNDDVAMVHIGYCIGRQWQNKGYMSEALRRVIAFFFEEVNINRIESRHDPNNPASGKVMLNAGMTFEGIQREADLNNQGLVDAAFYAILSRDYVPGSICQIND